MKEYIVQFLGKNTKRVANLKNLNAVQECLISEFEPLAREAVIHNRTSIVLQTHYIRVWEIMYKNDTKTGTQKITHTVYAQGFYAFFVTHYIKDWKTVSKKYILEIHHKNRLDYYVIGESDDPAELEENRNDLLLKFLDLTGLQKSEFEESLFLAERTSEYVSVFDI